MASTSVFEKGFLKGYSPFMISSVFGATRKGGTRHHGLDIACKAGTQLYAPVSGKVRKKTVDKGHGGLYISIRFYTSIDSFFDVYFMHMTSISADVFVGKDITIGEFIGQTGGNKNDKPNCGSSTGDHLHLEIRKNGTVPINPMPFLYKEKCIEKKTQTVFNWGTYQEGFNYILTDTDFVSLAATKVSKKDNTDYSATESIISNASSKSKNYKTSSKERLAPGIWQIVKLIVDSSVQNKQVMDSGISTMQGSILNFFRKVCQEPLVEFSGDTFGDQYYLIVRKPPFDKAGLTKMIDLTTIELSDSDIISTNLGWNTQGIYSWYQYMPSADLLGLKEGNLFMPAIFFPEFASVWGSKPLTIESNYYNFAYSGRWNNDKPENKTNGDNIIRNAVADLKFLIESNAYAPFTRSGSITMNGDRRIKRGTLVLHTSGEIFYVDSVSNNFDVSMGSTGRTTTLNVVKGMYPQFIYGKEIDSTTQKYSYFDIIDFGDFDINNVTSDNWKELMSKWKVNLNVFGFFMRREQLFWEQIYVNRQNK